MRAHSQDADLQIHGCRVLENLARYAPEAHAEAAVTLGLPEVVKALQTHKRSLALRKPCLKYLNAAMSRCPVAAARAFRGCSQVGVIAAMALTAKDKDQSSVRVSQVGCEVLRDLGFGSQKSMIIKAGALEAVCSAVRHNPSDPGLQRAGLEALASLTSHDQLAAARAVEAGGVEVAVTALRNHAAFPWVLRSACEALVSTIASRSDAAPRALRARCLEAIDVAKHFHGGNPQVTDLCCQVSTVLHSQAVSVH
eukprot:gnl/MRDRNA2_/MRDRNA2_274498_c0_seq1.p1 gnl/MRDRNA2_/MRDRNA2_274498_c0~~gnl/MRDRNA2_/MRDRNA2_274498_c0_seq1.p1  ORF type:complete len:276 (-),score=39.65 gnl/MRDRNA2_/MRDRNA2_274498_c0_seq1:27-785(-)